MPRTKTLLLKITPITSTPPEREVREERHGRLAHRAHAWDALERLRDALVERIAPLARIAVQARRDAEHHGRLGIHAEIDARNVR
jgi:hypothetical protein